jgi:hypothetical protein
MLFWYFVNYNKSRWIVIFVDSELGYKKDIQDDFPCSAQLHLRVVFVTSTDIGHSS